jgi:hypothetical protein
MANTLNGAVGGVTVGADGTGGLDIQTGGVNAISIGTGQTVTISNAALTNFSAASATITTGNLAFTGTAQRITGDMSNATIANRLAFQTSTTNGNTVVNAIPNGTATTAGYDFFNNSDTTNSGRGRIFIDSSQLGIQASNNGTGTFLSILFYTNGAEKARLTTTGNLLVGTTTDVSGVSGVISDAVGNLRNVPSAGAAKTSAYTLSISDLGEFVTVGSGGSITVPNDIFSAGNVISIYNDTTGNISINCPITTAYAAGTNTDRASLTLSTRGVATVLFVNPSLCVVTGNVS